MNPSYEIKALIFILDHHTETDLSQKSVLLEAAAQTAVPCTEL